MICLSIMLLFGLSQGADRPAELPAPAGAANSETRVFIVRHAEKDGTVKCPIGGTICVPLTAAGDARAAELARVLKGQPLKKIFSTEYKRTQDTARPSDRNPSIWASVPAREQFNNVLAEIAKQPGAYLIVTHSDVVIPFLRKFLGDQQISITAGAMPNTNPADVIIDDPDYDNLFLVTLGAGARPSCRVYFFGEKTAGDLAVTGCPSQGRVQ